MQASWPGLHMESQVQMLFDNVEKMRWCPIMSLVKGHMFQEHCKIIPPQKWWYNTPASLLGKTTNPNILVISDAHPDIDRKSILTSWCHGGVGAAIHPDMGITEFITPSLANPASSVNRMWATTHFVRTVCWLGIFVNLSEYYTPLKAAALFSTHCI
jgi:hypothetical protein